MLTSRLPALGVLGCALLALGYVGAVDPHEPGHYPLCPVLRYTGLLCPGCGGLRSMHALVHGDLPAAFAANAFVVVVLLAAAGGWAAWFARPAFRPRVPLTLVWSAGAVLLVFTVLRNLPPGAALSP
ncbi:DUF2752 domain-containing protein [Streptomyces sp. XM4193]|uniref:DUF2752 domain-containing protein n=1 Tax=Streptomyces sp. XM4193 TaxID=2929782 RepID=UPI001FF7C24D|nr:DUF2752 domain-containing protein [Streptomyces sp. XM4193]MCK1796405.1 DUF2752 domain-containing protein [Streptomyces sp. XM4193]